jgi:hypothetical protein
VSGGDAASDFLQPPEASDPLVDLIGPGDRGGTDPVFEERLPESELGDALTTPQQDTQVFSNQRGRGALDTQQRELSDLGGRGALTPDQTVITQTAEPVGGPDPLLPVFGRGSPDDNDRRPPFPQLRRPGGPGGGGGSDQPFVFGGADQVVNPVADPDEVL